MNNVNICCLQETEVPNNFPDNVLNSGNYNIELKLNDVKKRAWIYFHKDVKYKRRKDLELKNYHILICDVYASIVTRLICV